MNPRYSYPMLLAALLFAFALAGCGGGGGGTPGGGVGDGLLPPSGWLQGDYAYVVLVRDTAGGQVRSEMGLATANGQGGLSFTSTYVVSGGGTFGPNTPAAATYTEAADRSLSITGLTSVPLEGRVADDGSLAVLSSRGGSNPATAILTRRAVSPPISDLAGVWTYLEWAHLPLPNVAQSMLASATITPAGQLDISLPSLVYNLDGQINPLPIVFVTQQLTMQPSGWLTASFAPAPSHLRGAVSADRNLILLGGQLAGAKHASITVLVRKGQAASTAALAGDYFESNFESSFLGFLDGWGTMNLDGAGGGTWSYSLNLEGTPFGPNPINVNYGVLVDGTWGLIDTASSVAWNGIVGGGGRYAFLTGGFTPNASPSFVALVR